MSSQFLSVATQNIWKNNIVSLSPLQRALELAKLYERRKVDILFVQESVVVDGVSPAAAMANYLGWNFVENKFSLGGGLKQAVLSRFPLVVASEQPVVKVGNHFAISALVDVPMLGLVHATSAHLTHGSANGFVRVQQVAAIEQVAKPFQFAVLGMDGNSLPDSEPIKFLKGDTSYDQYSTLWLDTWDVCNPNLEGYTQDASMAGVAATGLSSNPHLDPAALPSRRIDYVMVRGWRYGAKQLGPVGCELVDPNGSQVLTDHKGLIATFSR